MSKPLERYGRQLIADPHTIVGIWQAWHEIYPEETSLQFLRWAQHTLSDALGDDVDLFTILNESELTEIAQYLDPDPDRVDSLLMGLGAWP